MRWFVLRSIAGVAVLAGTVYGHGPQIQITYNQDTDKIETRRIVDTGAIPNVITPQTRVYVMSLLEAGIPAGSAWYARPDTTLNQFNVPLFPTGPGITYQYDEAGQLPGTGWSYSGSGTLPNLQGTNFGYVFADGLKSWNGSGWVDPGVEQIQMFAGSGSSVPSVTASTSDSGPFATMALAGISSKSTNPHSSVSYRMLGDGSNFGLTPPGAGDDGIYLLSMQFTSTAAGVGISDAFHFVLLKNASLSAGVDAAMSLGFAPSQVQIVPEPVAGLFVAMMGLLMLRGPFGGRAL